jgi:predicted NAD/FAD-binding protein
VQRVERTKRGVSVNWNDNQTETFDEVIMATHADTSMATIINPDEEELETLKAFPYGENEGCLHTDTQTLPKNKRAWASWNYRLPRERQEGVSISYNMNLLQDLDISQTYCMSLNQKDSIDRKHVVQSMRFRHPIFRPGRQNAQKNHKALLRRKGISYCGAYWGYGFHEDGIRSALSVCKAFEIEPSF